MKIFPKQSSFFATVDPDEMDLNTLGHYRSALLSIGTVRIRQGQPEAALDLFLRARELTQSLLDRDRDQSISWYDLATHTYYIGEAYWEMQNIPQAAQLITESLSYAEKAAALQPDNFDYQLEVVFGLNNVGAVQTRLQRYTMASNALLQSLALISSLREAHPQNAADLLEQEVEAVSWLAEIAQKQSHYTEAFSWHDREIRLRRSLIETTDSPHHINRLSDALGYLAQSLMATGDSRQAVEILQDKVAAAQKVLATDPDNAFFKERLLIGQAMLANDQQRESVQRDLIYIASSRAYMMLQEDPAISQKIALAAAETAVLGLDRHEVNPILLNYYLRCVAVLAAAQHRLDTPPSEHVSQALDWLASRGDALSTDDLSYRVIFLHALQRSDESKHLADRLRELGFQSQFYTSILQVLG